MVAFTNLSWRLSAIGLLLSSLFFYVDSVVAEIPRQFKSRPDLYPPPFTIETSVPEKLSPGYIFVTPYQGENPGAYIYDNEGRLVWSGWGNSGPGNAHGFHVCKYKGADHLCFFQGHQSKGYCRGHGVILDNEYRIVRSVQPGGGMAASDMHEFLPINDGKTALMTVYQQRQFDMTPWNLKAGMGWLMQSIFQEVDVETSKVVFEWNSIDHVDPSDSYTWPNHTDTSGTGLDPHDPWDYFHINSIDKNGDGDYLVSSRHTSCIYKISGKDGTVLWRLHGANPTFQNINFGFSQQHDARWLQENTTHTVLSLYNNGWNGFNRTHDYSSGMIISIDHRDNTATQIREYPSPGKRMTSSSQGNMQVLPNGNVFMGWGNNAWVSEHDETGRLLLWGYIAKDLIMNYRALKFEWEGYPTDVPAMWTYSKTGDNHSPTTFYVSWNGATQVRSWKFYGAHKYAGPYSFLGEAEKITFETTFTHPQFYQWAHAEAVDAQGNVLAKSTDKFTFVPSPELRDFCYDDVCPNSMEYGFPDEVGNAIVPPSGLDTVPWSGLNLASPNEEPQRPPPPPSKPEQHSDDDEDSSSWTMAAFVGVALVVGFFVLRWWYRQQQRSPRGTRHDYSSDDVEDSDIERKPPTGTENLPWWDWRKWVDIDDEPPRYLPLGERRNDSRLS